MCLNPCTVIMGTPASTHLRANKSFTVELNIAFLTNIGLSKGKSLIKAAN